ncbi:hypothetical protein LC612_40855, partial [Nostoc sp. CHAB 5834]|nr:hypothetical protein [Nostoc sp. CHAB 5834]
MGEKIQYDCITKLGLTPALEAQIITFLTGSHAFRYFQSPHFFKACLASPRLTPSYILAREEGEIVG